jgi:transglutaminase-like putative cysteine protease
MKKFISIFVAALLFFSFAGVAHGAASPITKDQYYARSTLSGVELEYYDYIYDLVKTGKTSFSPKGYDISKADRTRIINYVYNDFADRLPSVYDSSEKEVFYAQLSGRSRVVLSLINNDMTEYEKVKAIYFYLCDNIMYDHQAASDDKNGIESKISRDAQTIVGGLLNNKAVCAGISRSFQYLLYQIGIPCYVVTGTLNTGLHGWNILKIDGEWYYADLTADIVSERNSDIFLYNDEFLKTHLVDTENNPPLPACTSTKYMVAQVSSSPSVSVVPTSIPLSTHIVQQANPPPWPIIIAASALAIVITVVCIKHKKRASS